MSDSYRQLPGHRRGFLQGATLWIASDHLLSVRSLRFREEYKRFYLRDIQAIVVAGGSRFHISTRAAVIAALWLAVFLAARTRAPWASLALGTAAVCLFVSWLYLSSARSCSCRIYTAVSRDNLPSIYRTWTARKFLAEVEPRIRQVQGIVEGNWAKALEERTVGPAALPVNASMHPPVPHPARTHTLASDIFVASLFADAALNILTLHSMTRTAQWIWYGLAVVEIAGAVVMFLQHYRGILRAAMQKLAIATLIALGSVYYLRQIMAGVAMGNRPFMPDPSALAALPSYLLLRQVDAGICVVLGLVGAALILMPRQDPV